MGRKGLIDFSQVDASTLDSPSEPLTTGRALIEFSDAPPLTIDVTKLPYQGIVRPLVDALLHRTKVGGPSRRPDTVRGFERAISLFATHLLQNGGLPRDASVTDLTHAHLNGFEDDLRSSHKDGSRSPAVDVNRVVVLLRRVAATKTLDEDLISRLMFSVNGEWGEHIPSEPYPEEIVTALLSETREKCIEIAREFPLRRGNLPPSTAFSDALEVIESRGFLSGRAKTVLAREVGDAYLLVHNSIYPTKGDLRPFLVRLALLTGWEPSVLASLTRDCIREESAGFVRVKLTKYRRHSEPHTEDWVRDGNLDTPGGIIRAVQKMTAPVHRWLSSDSLWVGFASNGKGPFREMNMADAATEWIKSSGVVDDTGNVMVALSLRRIRKSKKQSEYLESRGDLGRFAQGHTLTVAARHYADTEANRELHESTVESALDDVLNVASRSEVIASTGDDQADPEESQEMPTALNHWVCKCADHRNSPFIEQGKPCNVGFLMCLSCPNSKISIDNLPDLLALSGFLEEQAHVLSEAMWRERYSLPWAWIHRDILPQFSGGQIDSARARTEAPAITAYLALLEGGN